MTEARHDTVNPLAHASYSASAHDLAQLPSPFGPEVAFAGRSNAGKSSAINALVGHNRLAFVSKTPGRTQMINFFVLPGGRYLVDLPGYGYAKVPEAERKRWGHLIGTYLQTRPNLAGLVAIMDVRHPLTPLDRQLLDWFLPAGRPVHILLTKADKLSRQQAARQLGEVKRELETHDLVSVQLFSSLNLGGVEEARAIIGRWLAAMPLP
ncbi:MAG: YihA family ribosome biogenesis GTP-binding protein [Betaproteobacteria bacterium]|nr:YihA family ribosome biogenesis GTP-binding protein [Betaproteobacteria bacterium]